VHRLHAPPEIDANLMLITAILGFLCNVTNFVALNSSCCANEEEDEDLATSKATFINEDDNLTLENKSQLAKISKTKTYLSESLHAVYRPRQAHKCIHNPKSHQNPESKSLSKSQNKELIDIDYSDEENPV